MYRLGEGGMNHVTKSSEGGKYIIITIHETLAAYFAAAESNRALFSARSARSGWFGCVFLRALKEWGERLVRFYILEKLFC